jgi:adenine deaminase
LIEEIVSLGGGFITVLEGRLLGPVRLGVVGCMSSEIWKKVGNDAIACDDAV